MAKTDETTDQTTDDTNTPDQSTPPAGAQADTAAIPPPVVGPAAGAAAAAPSPAEQVHRIITPEEVRRAEQVALAEIERQVQQRQATELPEGGRYLLSDGKTWVDADGQPCKAPKR